MNNNLYNKYDELCNIIITNLYSFSKDKKEIQLGNINFKDKSHLCVLKIAEQLRGFTAFPIYVRANKIKIWKYNLGKKLKIYQNKEERDINIEDILDFIIIKNDFKDSSLFEVIYKEYYTKKGAKK